MFVYQKPKHAENLFFHIQYKDYPVKHTHRGYWEFMLVTEGTLEHRINGKIRMLSKGKLCIIRPDDVHSMHNKKGGSSSHLNLGVTSEFLSEYLSLLDKTLYEKMQTAPGLELTLSPSRTEKLVASAHQVLSASPSVYQRKLTLLFMDFMREMYAYLLRDEFTEKEYSAPVAALLAEMENPDNMKLSVNDLARQINYSYSHLCRLFRDELKTTPSLYFKKKKLDYAKKLMTETNMKFSEIAILIGYTSYSHFSTAFKETTGVSPADYCKDNNNYYLSVEEV